jgi:hypothetical protein
MNDSIFGAIADDLWSFTDVYELKSLRKYNRIRWSTYIIDDKGTCN